MNPSTTLIFKVYPCTFGYFETYGLISTNQIPPSDGSIREDFDAT